MRQQLFSFKALLEALRDGLTVKAEVNSRYLGKFTRAVSMKPYKNRNGISVPCFGTLERGVVYVVNELDFDVDDIRFFALV